MPKYAIKTPNSDYQITLNEKDYTLLVDKILALGHSHPTWGAWTASQFECGTCDEPNENEVIFRYSDKKAFERACQKLNDLGFSSE